MALSPYGPLSRFGLLIAAAVMVADQATKFLVLQLVCWQSGAVVRLTPFLDRLASRALVVDEMYAVVPHTNRALVPILCGIEPRIAQGYGTSVPGTCLPALLHAQGWFQGYCELAAERGDRS